jgi:hypothetical protein
MQYNQTSEIKTEQNRKISKEERTHYRQEKDEVTLAISSETMNVRKGSGTFFKCKVTRTVHPQFCIWQNDPSDMMG